MFWCRKTIVDDLSDLQQVIDSSAECNISQLVGSQAGDVIVPTYDWATMFSRKFKRLEGILDLHHLHFNQKHPGTVMVKTSANAAEKEVSLLKDKSWCPDAKDLPSIVHPNGLSLERQQYLYDKISTRPVKGTRMS